jgi:hypothetical protein
MSPIRHTIPSIQIPSRSCRERWITFSRNCSRKAGLPEKRVFIGEYGFPADHYSPHDQDELARRVMRTGLAWGCPFVLYWEIYNNAVTDGRQRGFWLIDDKGRAQPVYFTLLHYYQKARVWVGDFLRQRQRLPTTMEFGPIAAQWLQ